MRGVEGGGRKGIPLARTFGIRKLSKANRLAKVYNISNRENSSSSPPHPPNTHVLKDEIKQAVLPVFRIIWVPPKA